MKRVIRLVSALGAGASLVWGLARSLRGREKDTGTPDPNWPPKPAPAAKKDTKAEAKPAKPAAKAKPTPKAAPKKSAPAKAAPKAAGKAEPLVLKGVVVENPAKLLKYANTASEASLVEAGIKGKALSVVLESRPFKSADVVGDTKGIGRRTLQTLCAASLES